MAEPQGLMRVAFIRHPLDRVVSFYSRSFHQMPFETFVAMRLPDLMERDPHVAKYAEIATLATHIEVVEKLELWWPVYQKLKPQLFGDLPSQRANASKDHHRPPQAVVDEMAPRIMRLYPEDEALWLDCHETALRSYP